MPWLLVGGGGVVVLVLLGLVWRRRSAGRPAAAPAAPVPDPALPLPAPAAPAPPRARLAIDLLPARAGLTLISLAFEGDLLVRNDGDAPAADVRVEATLLPARSAQDGELGALFARGVARPAVPPFALAPGEERRVRIATALPLGGVEPLMAGGRAMLVPVLAANLLYAAGPGTGEGQAAGAWIVGVVREGQAKLAPFWLDAPRMSDRVAARPHALALSR